MTPAIEQARKAGVSHQVHEYVHDSSHESYGLEAAEKLGVAAEKVFKTLVVSLDNKKLAVGVLPVSGMLSMKRVAKAAGAKKATMAAKADVQRATGYVLGGVSPLGQKKSLTTVIDESALRQDVIYVSAGRRGLEISLSPKDLADLLRATFTDLCQ